MGIASDDWETPSTENDLRIGGKFRTRMQSKTDKTKGFDFTGIYTKVRVRELIEYAMDKTEGEDKPRRVKILLETTPAGTKVIETFDPENENSEEMQRSGWQAILNNFKKYVENS